MAATTHRVRPIPQARVSRDPTHIFFYHPAINSPFLSLPMYDYLQSDHNMWFGLHRETAITACRIVAVNKPGFLSLSRSRSDPPINDDFLVDKRLYYHLDVDDSEPYPICTDFRARPFPHSHFPLSWLSFSLTATTPEQRILAGSGTDLSVAIKLRDTVCRITGNSNSLTAAHIVPEAERKWFGDNDMRIYNFSPPRMTNDQHNLFALRSDIRIPQFDQKKFVITPKSGTMVVHFITYDGCTEYAQDYHDQAISTTHLAPQFLYARFAWAIFPQVADLVKGFSFRVLDRDATITQQGSKKRKRKSTPVEKLKSPDASASEPADDDVDSGVDGLEEKKRPMDYSGLAKKHFPFLLDPDGKADPYLYSQLSWYPGMEEVEKKKRQWMEDHPNIRACSGSDFKIRKTKRCT